MSGRKCCQYDHLFVDQTLTLSVDHMQLKTDMLLTTVFILHRKEYLGGKKTHNLRLTIFLLCKYTTYLMSSIKVCKHLITYFQVILVGEENINLFLFMNKKPHRTLSH